MAKVVLQQGLADSFTDGETHWEIDAKDVRALIRELDAKFPGIGEQLNSRTAVAIDGEIFQDPLLQATPSESEVYFLPMIEGG
ncbi:MAG: MoaD/ThiS family protein [Pseudomonadota bacterium]